MSGVVVRETLRRHLTHFGYLAFVALLAVLTIGMSQFEGAGSAWPTLIGFMAIIVGSGVIGPEFTSGTLQLVLVKPVSRCDYLIARVTGVVLSVWIAAAVAFVCEVAGRAVSGAVPWSVLGLALLNAAADAVITVALLAFLGSVTRGYANVSLYFGIRIVLALLLGYGAARVPASVTHFLRFIHRNLYPAAPGGFDRDWLLLVLSNSAILLVLGCLAFARREVPYGAD